MRFDAVVLRTDGTWESFEDLVRLDVYNGVYEFTCEDGSLISLDNVAMLTIQPK